MADLSPDLKRVKRKIKKCQNPLFEKWLKEWKEEAKTNGSESHHCFNMALKSLKKFPFKLNTGKECIILENFGAKICQMLDKKLKEHQSLYSEDNNQMECNISKTISNNFASKEKNRKKKKSDLNIDILNVDNDRNLEKQKHNIQIPKKVLPLKKTILESKFESQYKKADISNVSISKNEDNNCNRNLDESIFMLPNTFKILLLVDNQERDKKSQQSEHMTMRYLKSRNVDFEIRHLKVGDFIWVARNNMGQELVLPYIIERKRIDDLASSIKDGRFHEQKFRLKQSGIENLIYLVEKYGTENQRVGLPLPTLMQAISNTQIVNNFTVQITLSHNHSMRYLDILTRQLNNVFKNKTLVNCKKSDIPPVNLSDGLISLMTFEDFSKGSEKNKKSTVRSMLIKHLLQLNGLSVEKSKAISQYYPTPKLLMAALNEDNGEKNISKITYGNFNRSIGMVTAKQMKMLYTSSILN